MSNNSTAPATSSPAVSNQATSNPPATSQPAPSSTIITTSSFVTTSTTSLSPTSSTTVLTHTTVVNGGASSNQPQQNSATTIVHTITRGGTTQFSTHVNTNRAGATRSAASSSSGPAALNNGHSGGSGSSSLSTGAITAIAVVIPVAVLAILIGLGIVFYRRRKSKQEADEIRRKEVEDYSYNPNGDPTLPAIGSDTGAQMTEDHSSGYRGWGAATASNRKMSTTLSGGHTQQLSDSGNSYGNPSSPGGVGYSDGHSSDPIVVNNRDTLNSDDLGALGVAPATAAATRKSDLRRGPSNASSAYSAGDRSDDSEPPPLPSGPISHGYDYSGGYGYGQHGPYGDGSYGGGQDGGMPVVRDLNARRNTRIQPGGAYQQGNSGIAQNF